MVESQDLRDGDQESRLEAWLKNEQLSFISSRGAGEHGEGACRLRLLRLTESIATPTR